MPQRTTDGNTVFVIDPSQVQTTTYVTVDGSPIPTEFLVMATITTYDDAYRVEARFSADANGWPRLDQGHAQTRVISRPLADRIAAAALAHLRVADETEANEGGAITYDAATLAAFETQIRATLHKATYNGDSGKAWTEEKAARVKAIAEAEIAAGRNPDEALAKVFGITPKTAATYRSRAGVKKPNRGRPPRARTNR